MKKGHQRMKKSKFFILSALTILSLSGCTKDKPEPTEPAPLETITPEETETQTGDKLDDIATDLKAETMPEDMVVVGWETDASEENTSQSTNETSDSESLSDEDTQGEDTQEGTQTAQANTITSSVDESRAQEIIEEEQQSREDANESKADFAEQQQGFENAINDYYQKELESLEADEDLQRQLEELNPYK